jgi:hypothetical protein
MFDFIRSRRHRSVEKWAGSVSAKAVQEMAPSEWGLAEQVVIERRSKRYLVIGELAI